MEASDLQQKIDSHIMSLPEFRRPFEIRMSTAGFCPKMMSYGLANQEPRAVGLQQAMRMLTGEPIHAFYRAILTEIFGDDYQKAEEEVSITFDGMTVKGHPDGFISSINAVVEVKSVSEHTFKMVQNQDSPLEAHRMQANIYAKALCAGSVLFIYHNRNDGNYLVLLVPYSEELAEKTIGNWRMALSSLRSGTELVRPYHDATASPCFYCDYKDKCYEGFKEQVASGENAKATDPDVIEIGEAFRNVRRLRLTHEKTEEAQKAALSKIMIEKRIQAAKFDWGHVEIKVGKNNNPLVSIKENKEV
jgi:hypothetical protein